MPDANEILSRWEAVCEAATKGPWELGDGTRNGLWHGRYALICQCDLDAVYPADLPLDRRVLLLLNTHFPYESDAAFIAAARTGWPAAIRALEHVVNRLMESAGAGDPFARLEIAAIQAILEGRDA